VAEGDTVSPFYDPMLGKLIAWGENREQARQRLLAMLAEMVVGGVRTNLAFLRRVLAHPAFANAELDTGFIPRHQAQLLPPPSELSECFWPLAAQAFVLSEPPRLRDDDPRSPWAARNGWRAGAEAQGRISLRCADQQRDLSLITQPDTHVRLEGEQLLVTQQGLRSRHLAIRRGETLYLQWGDELQTLQRLDPIADAEAAHTHHGGLSAPMNGSIVRVLVEAGQSVAAGTALVVLEAMKMEHSIRAPQDGVVKALYCSEGDMVSEGAVLVDLEEAQTGDE
jgi:3-methylcrotonyl-CoA carboxylase alpha subunit